MKIEDLVPGLYRCVSCRRGHILSEEDILSAREHGATGFYCMCRPNGLQADVELLSPKEP